MGHATARRIRRDARYVRTGSRGFDHFKALKIKRSECEGVSVGARIFGGMWFEWSADDRPDLVAMFRHPTKRMTLARVCRRRFVAPKAAA